MALSAHKLRGPKGVGCLVARDARPAAAARAGAAARSAATAPAPRTSPGCVGFAAALAAARAAADHRLPAARPARGGAPGGVDVVCAGARPAARPQPALGSPGVRAELLVLALDREGYAVAAGSACSAGDAEPSHVLVAQGMSAEDARSVIRVSLGPERRRTRSTGSRPRSNARSGRSGRASCPPRDLRETRRHVARLTPGAGAPGGVGFPRWLTSPGRSGREATPAIGAVMLVVAALVVTMVGIALASWYGGENHAGTTTVTVTSAAVPAGCRDARERRRRSRGPRLRPLRLRPVPRGAGCRRRLAGRARADQPSARRSPWRR